MSNIFPRFLNLGRSENMASTSSAHVLMKKGKRGAAAYVHSECANTANPQNLNELLDIILNPGKSIDEWETIDWCKWLMAGGRTPDEFSTTVHCYDNATTCGLVWTANFVAYRCRTCGISPCMSLCAECFQKGNHDGHDFNMFRSQAGGACDCGDTSVMKETGFCDRHGPKAQVHKPAAPGDLMCVAQAMMPRIILRLIQHLREHSNTQAAEALLGAIKDADAFLTMLHDFSAMGAAMRRVMTGALTNPQLYKNLTEYESGETEFAEFMRESKRIYEEAVKSLPNPEPPDEYKDCPSLQEQLIHRTFLEELVFWTVKFEFPQKMVCLLLNMLPDPDYKEALTQAFVLHYSRISMMLERSSDPDALSNRVVHVSVQLFSNEGLAFRMAEKLNLLHVMVISLKYMMGKILIQNTLHDQDKNFHYVVDCGRQVMKEHCYWPLVSDLNNVLSHKAVALRFMNDDGLLEMWFAFLAMFQGMNVNQREVFQHVEFEPNTYYAAFSAELEASAYPMWSMVSHLNDPSLVGHTKRVLASCLTALQDWLDAVNFTDPSVSDTFQVSFHLPLHRYFSVFMCQAIKQQGVSLRDVLPSPDILHLMMMHPLRVQVAFYEILGGMWVRNGLQIKGQAMTYIQCNFCNSMVDADIYLLQVCATQLPPHTFLDTVADKFHIKEWMSMAPFVTNSFLEGEHDTAMLESFLTFLATLMSVRTNLGLCDVELTQLEMVTLLCMGDKTHSQLLELMPERCGNYQGRDFESELSEVADYRAPNFEASGNMQQGMYSPKAHVWENMYDPVHVLLRAVHRRDFQSSMDHFTEYARQTNQVKSGSTPWPPFRIPSACSEAYEDPRKLLCSKTFHAMVFAILFRAIRTQNVPEQALSLAIFLLEMAVEMAEPFKAGTQVCQTFRSEPKERFDLDFNNWFESDWLSANLRTVVDCIMVKGEARAGASGGYENWESGNTEGEVLTPSSEGTSLLMLEEGTGEASAANPEDMAVVPAGSLTPRYALAAPTVYPAVLAGTEVMPALPAAMSLLLPRPYHAPALTESGVSSAIDAPGPSAPFAGSACTDVVPSSPTSSSDLEEIAPLRRRVFTNMGNNMGAPYHMGVGVGESLISLLLKLHSNLSGAPDSFELDEETPNQGPSSTQSSPPASSPPHPASESRVGDGPFFLAKILHRISKLDPMCREAILETKNRLWPKKEEERDEEREAREAREREERRRRAKDRQQRLMAEFATKQKQFMEKTRETEEEECGDMDWTEVESPMISKKEYDCVICNQATPSTDEKPMGLVVLLQATSILGHKRKVSEAPLLPTSEEERQALKRDDSLASEFDRRVEELNRQFDSGSWLLSVNLGWEGGVHVQTCGHHLHLDCLKSYLHSLRSQQRQQSLAVERGEYSCPLCRQLANSVLPLSPELGECAVMVRSRPSSMASIVSELAQLFKENPPTPSASSLVEAMGKSMEDMTNSTYVRYKQQTGAPSPQCLFLFVSSIARTNLEVEVVQRGGSLVTARPDDAVAASLIPKRSCIVPLLHVLAMHARVLAHWPSWTPWQQAAGITVTNTSALSTYEREVPLLLRESTALLTQFLLLLPLHLEQTYFSCVVKVLYNVLYFQTLAQLSCSLPEVLRTQWCSQSDEESSSSLNTLEGCLGLVLSSLEPGQLYLEEATGWEMQSDSNNKKQLEAQIQSMCLPFLRIATLLRHHLYGEELPEVRSEQSEFVRLVYYLELVTEGMDWSRFNAAVALNWAWSEGCTSVASTSSSPSIEPRAPISVIQGWCAELLAFAQRSQSAARSLILQHNRWHQPHLLRLPHLYDKVFQFYHRRQCSQCHSVPRETSVCLLCGTVVCLKENCCKQQNICEAVQHSIDCGAGTAMYLVVTSSYIIVIRGKRACLWGSVYLDSFGEEDRDLKRGKPLYLSPGRYQLLEQQWLSHRFDHTNKKWVWHRDAL